jgi:hypothetical protein
LEKQQVNQYVLPDSEEIELFTQKAKEKLKNLNFEAKKAIVGTLVEKVVGNTEELVVSGYIPLEYLENHVSFITSYRNRGAAKCRQVDVI